MMGIKNFLGRLLGVTQPVWSYGLECRICKKTFVSAEAHAEYVERKKTKKYHEGKVPLLRGSPRCN